MVNDLIAKGGYFSFWTMKADYTSRVESEIKKLILSLEIAEPTKNICINLIENGSAYWKKRFTVLVE